MQVYQLHLQGMFLMKITRWTAFFIQNTRLSTQQRISTTIRTFIPNIYPCRKISMNFNITLCVSLWYLCIHPVEKCAHFDSLHFIHVEGLWPWTLCSDVSGQLANLPTYTRTLFYMKTCITAFICFMWRQAVQHLLLFQFAISHGPHVSVQFTAVNIHLCQSFNR